MWVRGVFPHRVIGKISLFVHVIMDVCNNCGILYHHDFTQLHMSICYGRLRWGWVKRETPQSSHYCFLFYRSQLRGTKIQEKRWGITQPTAWPDNAFNGHPNRRWEKKRRTNLGKVNLISLNRFIRASRDVSSTSRHIEGQPEVLW